VAVRSKAWVCGRSLTVIVGPNPTGGHECLSLVSVVYCKVEVLRRAAPSSRGVLPTVVCLMCVIVKPRRNEEAQAHIRLSSHRKKIYVYNLYVIV
jgi:hypothetical protein